MFKGGLLAAAGLLRRASQAPRHFARPRQAYVQYHAANYAVASSSVVEQGSNADEPDMARIQKALSSQNNFGSEDDPPRAPKPGGPFDGVKLEPYERLIVDRYGDEQLQYVGKRDTRPLSELDFKEMMEGKYYNLRFTEDQIYAFVMDTAAGYKIGKTPDFNTRLRDEMRKLYPDTFGKFGDEHEKDLSVTPSKRQVFKVNKEGRPLSSAFFTTAPVYYEEIDRLRSALEKLDELQTKAELEAELETHNTAPTETTAAAAASTVTSEKAGVDANDGCNAVGGITNNDVVVGDGGTGNAARTEDMDADADLEDAPTKRPVIPGENRVLTWDEKQELLTLWNKSTREYPPWVDDNGEDFWDKTESEEDVPMVWHSLSELQRALESPFTKAEYRRLLRYAKMVSHHPQYNEEEFAKVILKYRKRQPASSVTTTTRRPLDSLGQAYATGRKKNASAVAYLKSGTGKIRINKLEIHEFCGGRLTSRALLLEPFIVSNTLGDYDVDLVAKGGGKMGQIVACRHSIAKAIENYTFNTKSEEEGRIMRKLLKDHRLLQRDPRRLERQKAGQHGARAKKRWTKR